MLDVQQAFLRRIDDHNVVSPQRSPGGQRRYTRDEIGRVQEVVTMMGEGMTLPAIRRIIELQYDLARLTAERDELARIIAVYNADPAGECPGSRTAGRPPGSDECR